MRRYTLTAILFATAFLMDTSLEAKQKADKNITCETCKKFAGQKKAPPECCACEGVCVSGCPKTCILK